MKEKFARDSNSHVNIGKLAKEIYDKKREGLTQEEIEKYDEEIKKRMEDSYNTGIEVGKIIGRKVSNNWELYSQIDFEEEKKIIKYKI